MPTLIRHIRHAFRSALRQPGTTLVIVLTLAVGIGASTAIFTLLAELYWWQVEAPEPDRLFFVQTGTQEYPAGSASYLDALAYREATADLGDLVLRGFFGAVVGLPGQGDGGGENRYTIGSAVSPEFFDFFGVRFAQGRGFLPDENRPEGPPVAVVDHIFWSRHLGADPSIVGRTIRLNGIAFTVVGVAPQGFQGTGFTIPVYVPTVRLDDLSSQPVFDDRGARRFQCLLRLRERVERETVEARLAVVGRRLDSEHPWPGNSERRITLQGLEESNEDVGPSELMLAGAVGLLLLLATANVANLLLARAAGRRREIAVRAALGAGRGRIAGRLLTESVLLAVAGGGLGVGLARWLTAYIRRIIEVAPIGLPDWAAGTEWMRYDERVLVFTLITSVVTGCLFGLAPVLHAARTDLVGALKGSALETKPGRRHGARQLLVVVQVTISTVLLLGAALLLRGLASLEGRDPGFETAHLLLAPLSTAPPRAGTPAERRQAQRELYELGRQRLAELPGVAAATLTSDIVGGGWARETRLVLPEQPDASYEVDRFTVGRGFLETYAIALPKGRPFDDGDRAGGRGAAIVNQAFVERFWGDDEPLGRVLRLPDLGADTADDRFVVVGVAEDVRHASRTGRPEPLVYLPLAQHLWGSRMVAVARTLGPPQQIMPSARAALASAHPDLALVELATYERQAAVELVIERLTSAVAALFSVFGLGLACLGIYSVMSYSVSYRRRELGIRTAIGATSRDLQRLVLGEASGLVAAGILLGVAAALALARGIASLLYGVAPHDLATFLPLPFGLALVGLAAAWLPAWRAGRIDPKVALQAE